jgi:hypothetical protein
MADITVFTRRSLGTVTPDALLGGIGDRLALLTYLFCPDEEEKPDVVLARLRVTPAPGEPSGAWGVWRLRYGRAHNAEIRVERTAREAPATPAKTMAWPIGVAAAAWLASRGDG